MTFKQERSREDELRRHFEKAFKKQQLEEAQKREDRDLEEWKNEANDE